MTHPLKMMEVGEGRMMPTCPYCMEKLDVQGCDDAPKRLYLDTYCHRCMAHVMIEVRKSMDSSALKSTQKEM